MILNYFQKILKNSTTSILKPSLLVAMMVIGSCGTVSRVTLQQRLMWDHQILEKQIESFTTSGLHAQLMHEVMECATLRIDGQDFPSWHRQRLLTRLLYLETLDLGSYQSQVEMLKRCLRTKLYQSQLITRSFSNPSRMAWKDRRQNSRIRYPRVDSLERHLPSLPKERLKKAWTQRSTGRIPETTRMMERNYNSSSMMNQANGRSPIIFSTTGGLQKPVLGSEQE